MEDKKERKERSIIEKRYKDLIKRLEEVELNQVNYEYLKNCIRKCK